jgi:hypothetical protein
MQLKGSKIKVLMTLLKLGKHYQWHFLYLYAVLLLFIIMVTELLLRVCSSHKCCYAYDALCTFSACGCTACLVIVEV